MNQKFVHSFSSVPKFILSNQFKLGVQNKLGSIHFPFKRFPVSTSEPNFMIDKNICFSLADPSGFT